MGAVTANAEFTAAAPHLLANQVCRSINHDTCVVAPRRTWPDGMWHGADRGLDIARIDTRAKNLDDTLTGPRRCRIGCHHGQCKRVNIGGLL